MNNSTIAHPNLPVQSTPFLGRQDELSRITALLADPDCHMVTLIGPGGIGKTRLALAVGETIQSGVPALFSDGVFFVSLQSVPTPDLIISSIAETVDFPFFFGDDPAEQLFSYLEPKSLLLVLDNFEHLLDGAVLLSDLLACAPGVKILTTSRERLNLLEEWSFEVEGLHFPTDPTEIDCEGYSAIELFAQNARRVRPSFSLEAESSAVIRICSLVGGMPLALELASSWVRALSCAEIADEIQRGLDILETSARNIPSRHRDMRAVIDHSWLLLTENERDTFMKLSVFQGGFDRDSAQEVTWASPRLFSGLVDKSWLHWNAEVGRYDVHELLRQYGQGKLEDSGEAETVRHAHARAFAKAMRELEDGIKWGGRQAETLAEIEIDFDNIRAAWKWAVHTRDTESLNRMAEALNFFCDMRARWSEGEELFRLAQDAFARAITPNERLTYAHVFARRVRMVSLGMKDLSANNEATGQQLEAGIALARECGDLREEAFQYMVLGMIVKDVDRAVACFERMFMIAAELDDRFYMAEAIVWANVIHNNYIITQGFLDYALSLQIQTGDQNGMSWTLIHLSRKAFFKRDYAAVQRYMDAAIDSQRARGDKKGLYWSMIISAQWYMMKGDFEQGLTLAQEAMDIASNLNLTSVRQGALATLGLFLIMTESDYEAGERMCAEAVHMRSSNSHMIGDLFAYATCGLALAAYHKGQIEQARGHYNHLADYLSSVQEFGEFRFSILAPVAALNLAAEGSYENAVELLSAAFQLSEVAGSPETRWLDKAPLITRLLHELKMKLGESVYEAAWKRGKSIDINVAVNGLLKPIGPDHPIQLLADPTPSPQSLLSPLTDRELEVLRLVSEGLSNREIADRLVLSVGTVKWYVSEIYSKLGVTSRTQAAAQGRALGLIA